MTDNNCNCGKLRYTLGFSCCGASDVGNIADQAWRQLAAEKVFAPSCIAGIGCDDADITAATRGAQTLVAIDGCPKNCTAGVLAKAGFAGFVHVRLADLGMEKKQSPPTPERVAAVVANTKQLLGK